MRTKFLFGLILLFALAVSGFTQTKEAKMFYEFDFRHIQCEEAKLWVDYFADELYKTPESKGYIIYYGGKTNPYGNKLPYRNESKVRMGYFMEDYQVSTRLGGNAKLIDGGYREKYTAQFWVVPKGAILPIPSPTFKTEEIKFRKGKYRRAKQGEGC
ncbi:MAG: hypothetical protein M3033_06400 [Acidobacteriota bacterium]|nr:hypothetical protein [Acidobacteriota bacterium]